MHVSKAGHNRRLLDIFDTDFKVLVALCHSFLYIYSYIHSYKHSLITFAEALLHICIAAGGAKPRFELEPAIQQASALPSQLRCTQNLSSANGCRFKGSSCIVSLSCCWVQDCSRSIVLTKIACVDPCLHQKEFLLPTDLAVFSYDVL